MGSEKLLNYFEGDELASSVWQGKYAIEGEETPDDMHKRMAKEFARIEHKYIHKEKVFYSEKTDKAFIDAQKNLSNYGKERGDLTVQNIYSFFHNFKHIIPQGSIMSQLGAPQIGSLSNCFVVGQPVDSYGGIFQKEEEMVQLMKRRGGVGIDISTLRPAGTPTTNAAKSSTGAVSFMHRYSNGTREVAQNGRRGALMISIDIKHPDSLEFMKIKRDLSQVTGANISVKLNDDFMRSVESNQDYVLRFPCEAPIPPNYNYLNYNEMTILEGQEKILLKKIKAKEYWDEIIKSAHNVAEPGLMFWDRMVDYSPDGVYAQFKQVTTNPCSEIGMQPYDACRLMAMNLFSFVKNPWTPEAYFDFEEFYKTNYEAMRLSDDLIDLELEHIERILAKIEADIEEQDIKQRELDLWYKVYNTAKASRRTGLGFTALGDTLAALGLAYDSQQALTVTEQIMEMKMKSELDCTIDLAILRGTFEGWDRDAEFHVVGDDMNGYVMVGGENPFYQFIYENYPEQAIRMNNWGRRNVSWSTVAPTGSLSIMAKLAKYSNVSSGMEPIFMPFYMRRKKVNPGEVGVRVDFTDQNGDTWQEYPVIMAGFKEWIETNYEQTNIDNISKNTLQSLFEVSPYYGSTANDIDWVKRVQMQSVIQKYITHSISSTINLPNDVTEAEVSTIYLQSWKQGLKGITVYRDGSRSGVLVSDSKKDETFNYVDAIKRPKVLEGVAHTTKVNGVICNIIIGLIDSKPYEIFIDNTEKGLTGFGDIIKKSKGHYYFKQHDLTYDISSNMTDEQAAITRLVSTSLRHGADIKFIVEQLTKCDGDLFSFTKGLARVLKKYIPDGVKSTVSCLDCNSDNVIFQEGCMSCQNCGSSKCG